MTSETPVNIAVIGSGPAGCFFSQSLLRGHANARITIFDRLPSPYGLVRYGVAADHQHTKAITRQFERVFEDERVTFAGNVSVGTDVTLQELRDCFDAVVLATGLSKDRPLEIPGDQLAGVHGAGVITRVLNSHPGERPELPELGDDVVIVGGGNVAIDLVRFLVKDRDGYDDSDIADHALDHYLSHPAKRVTLLNRSQAAQAKSDPLMIKELAALPRATYQAPELGDTSAIDGDRAASARLAALASLVDAERPAHPGPSVSLRFGALPVRILGEDRVEAIEIAVGDNIEVIPASSVLTAIGFQGKQEGDPFADYEFSESGRLEPGLYRTGWAKRGPIGAIPENRADAKLVADEVLADIADGSLSAAGRPGIEGLSELVTEQAISYQHWQNLEQHEREIAPPGRIRRKLTDSDAMLEVARQNQR